MPHDPLGEPTFVPDSDGYASGFRERALESPLAALLEALPAPSLLIRQNGTFSYASTEAARLLGYATEELVETNWLAVETSEDVPAGDTLWQRVSGTSKVVYETLLRHKDGSDLPFTIHAARLDLNQELQVIAQIFASQGPITPRSMRQRNHARSHEVAFRIALGSPATLEFVGSSCERLLGYSPRELSDMADWLDRLVHPDDRTLVLDPHGVDDTAPSIVRFVHRDGRYVWMSFQKTVEKTVGQTVAGREPQGVAIEGHARDITRELELEQALEESVELLRAVMDHAPVIVWSVNSAGTFELSEGRGLENLGLEPGQVVGQSIWDLYAAFPKIIEATHLALTGKPTHGTWDLGEIQFDFHYSPHLDRNGRPSGATGVAVDVTRRHRAEHESLRLLTAIEQASESVVLTNQAGTVTYVNPAYEKTSGYARLQVLDTPWRNHEVSGDAQFLTHLAAAIETGAAWSGRTRSRRATGTHYDEDVTLSPIRDPEGVLLGTVAVKRDVTEQLRWEEQLRQSQKMEAVGQLAGGIAHDFNNLLQIIRGNLELLAHQPLDEYPQQLADDIAHATDRAVNLVRQLLAFSRKDSVEFVTLRLDRVIYALLGMLRRLLGEDIEVDWQTGTSLPHIRANAPQLEQIVVNLCVNARDAMPQGGKLVLRVSEEPLPASLVASNGALEVAMYAVLTIADTGVGISPEVRDRMFEPFFTTKGVGKGTGLGLATVYAIMERHGGFIDVSSTLDQGTTFRMYFPTVVAQDTPSGSFVAHKAVNGQDRLVLVAEDDPQIRNLTARFLVRAGFRVILAVDGAEAHALICQHENDLSLVILDAIMPNLRGPEVYRLMRNRGSQIPCLIVTGYDFQSLDPIPELERAQVLQKPFDGQQLFDKLDHLLNDASVPKRNA